MAITLREHAYAGYLGAYAELVVRMQAATRGGSCWEAEKVESPLAGFPSLSLCIVSTGNTGLLEGMRADRVSGLRRSYANKIVLDRDASLEIWYQYAT